MEQIKVRQLNRLTFSEQLKTDTRDFLKTLYIRNYPNLEAYILKNSGNSDDAGDIYQEGFLAVWRNIEIGRFSPNSENEFSSYLFKVCKNKWIDHLRKNNKRVSLSIEEIEDGQFEQQSNEGHLYIEAVKRQYNNLGEKCKEVLGLFYYQKQSMKQIADKMQITEASAKNNKYRCLQRLRELVLNEGKKQ